MYENNKSIYSNKYLLSKKDIFGIDYIHKLIEAGVTSLKIEGRSKSVEYVGIVTEKYRKCIDSKIDETDRKNLNQMFIRSTESYGYFDKVGSIETISENSAKNTGLKLGKVIAVKDEYIKLRLEENIDLHDGIEVYTNENVVSTIVTCIKNENYITLNKEVLSDNIVWIGDISKNVNVGDIVYKTSSSKLNKEYKDKILKISRKKLIDGKVNILKDTNISMDLIINNEPVNVSTDYIPQVSVSKSVDSEYVYNQFSKTIDSPFEFANLSYNISDNLFVPVSKLNELRREIIKKLDESYVINIDVTDKYSKLSECILNHNELLKSLQNGSSRNKNSIFVYKYNPIDEYKYMGDYSNIIYLNISDIRRYELQDIDIVSKYIEEKDVYIYIPSIVLSKLDRYIDSNLERLIKLGAKGILFGNIGYLTMIKDLKSKYNIKVVADYSLNIVNTYSAMFFKEKGIDKITISPEIDESEIQNIARVTDIEVIENFVTAMTSRFCPVKAYSKACNCNNNMYELKDNYNNVRYNVICDNTDCTVKLVRNISCLENNIYNKRKCII